MAQLSTYPTRTLTKIAGVDVSGNVGLAAAGGVSIGGVVTSGTAGSVLFVDASGNVGQDNSNFFYDSTNHALTLGSGAATVILNSPVFDGSQVWNNSGVTFTGIKLNITNTASAAASMLQDWQVGGSSAFNIGVTGSAKMLSGASLGWASSSTDATQSADVLLQRDAAAVLAQRNSTTAQSFRIYNTYTSSTNFEAASLDWVTTANALTIATKKGSGGGTARDINLAPESAKLNLTGNSIGGTSSGTGFLMALGYNVSANKQYWLGDPDYVGNATSAFLRVIVTNGFASLSGVNGTNAANKAVSIDTNSWLDFGGTYLVSSTTSPKGIYFNNNGPTYFAVVSASNNGSAASALTFGRAGSAGGSVTHQVFSICETGILAFGGMTASFPGIVNSSAELRARLADDSGDANFRAKSVRGTAVTFANRPTAVEGMLVAFTDSTTATWGATITGTGANHVLGYYNGTNWTVAAA